LAGDWISAGAEVFSAVGTVGAFLLAFGLLRREHRREAERAEDQRRAQASQISACAREVAFHIHNASDMPIYEVALPLPAPAGEEPAEEFIGLVPPGQTIRRPAPAGWRRSYTGPEPVQVEFLDSAGRRWTRDEQGTLARGNRDSQPAG
jgi:hypothetical protein